MATAQMIIVNNLTLQHPKKPAVLSHISFEIPDGEITSILGPNGSGKTTLLRAILGLFPFSEGTILIHDQELASYSRKELAKTIAYVPQQHSAVFAFSVEEVVLMGRTAKSPWLSFSARDHALAKQALDTVHLSSFANRSYVELSGGERQLVLIARALAQGCKILVMDEPETALDYGNQFLILDCIRKLADVGYSIVLTTHHPDHARYLGGKAILIKNGSLMAQGDAVQLLSSHETLIRLYGLGEKAQAWLNTMYGKNKNG